MQHGKNRVHTNRCQHQNPGGSTLAGDKRSQGTSMPVKPTRLPPVTIGRRSSHYPAYLQTYSGVAAQRT